MKKMFKKFDLSGKTALITGAAGLLGVEHAIAMIESGATVVLTDIDSDALTLIKKSLSAKVDDDRILLYKMDVTNIKEITCVSEDLISSGKRVDILINNAAIDPKVKGDDGLIETSRLESFPIDQWDLQILVGLKGSFLCSRVFGSKMAKDGRGGVILNIASDLSVISPDQRLYKKEHVADSQQPVKPITYSVIKSGLVGMTKYLSTYWADKGVRANALSPGGVYNGQDDNFVKKISQLIPLSRMAEHDEYHSAVQFLCSDASSYMNGQNVIIDGGRSSW